MCQPQERGHVPGQKHHYHPLSMICADLPYLYGTAWVFIPQPGINVSDSHRKQEVSVLVSEEIDYLVNGGRGGTKGNPMWKQ